MGTSRKARAPAPAKPVAQPAEVAAAAEAATPIEQLKPAEPAPSAPVEPIANDQAPPPPPPPAEQLQPESTSAAAAEAQPSQQEATELPDDAQVIDDAADLAGLDLDGRKLRVRSIARTGRRRAGMAFTPEPTELLVDDLDADQIGALLGDPELVVELD